MSVKTIIYIINIEVRHEPLLFVVNESYKGYFWDHGSRKSGGCSWP